MKRIFCTAVLLTTFLPVLAAGQGFSLFGVTLGMPRAEVDRHWEGMENGQYG